MSEATPDLAPTARTTLKRLPQRGHYDRAVIDAILDEALVGHLGFVHEGSPMVVPTICARAGDEVYVHGSVASRALRTLAAGAEVCLTVTLLDGLVLARSGFHSSMNYRSVVLLGAARPVIDDDEKRRALDVVVDHVVPGRAADVRPATVPELRATSVLALPIEEGSAKVRTGGPVDDEEDYGLDVWAGVIPLRLQPGAPVDDPRLKAGLVPPANVTGWRRPDG